MSWSIKRADIFIIIIIPLQGDHCRHVYAMYLYNRRRYIIMSWGTIKHNLHTSPTSSRVLSVSSVDNISTMFHSLKR